MYTVREQETARETMSETETATAEYVQKFHLTNRLLSAIITLQGELLNTVNREREYTMAKKGEMTTRIFLNGVIEIEGISDELKTFAQAALEKLDATNAKRKDAPKKPSKAAENNAPIAAAIVEYLNGVEGTVKASEVKDGIGIEGITVQKVNAVLRSLVTDGKIQGIENGRKPIEYKAIPVE